MIYTVYSSRTGRVKDSGENLVKLCRKYDLPIKPVCGALLAGKMDEHVHNGQLITVGGRA
jgi:hypothetical protein